MQNETFLTQEEAARVLRLSPRTLERHRLTGNGPPFVKIGRRVLYRRSDIDDWAESHTFGSTSEADAAAGSGQAGVPRNQGQGRAGASSRAQPTEADKMWAEVSALAGPAAGSPPPKSEPY